MKRIITFIAALAFVSGGIISAQEQGTGTSTGAGTYTGIFKIQIRP